MSEIDAAELARLRPMNLRELASEFGVMPSDVTAYLIDALEKARRDAAIWMESTDELHEALEAKRRESVLIAERDSALALLRRFISGPEAFRARIAAELERSEMTTDAAEPARLRCCPAGSCKRPESERDDSCLRDSLIDALEEARRERDEAQKAVQLWREIWAETSNAVAERDSPRALLGEAQHWVGHGKTGTDLRARITAFLEPKS